MKKAVISVFVCTAVFALLACGKTAATGNSSEAADSTASTVSTTTVTTSTQMENVQKPTRVNQESRLSPGVQKNEPINWDAFSSQTHHSETHHSENHHH